MAGKYDMKTFSETYLSSKGVTNTSKPTSERSEHHSAALSAGLRHTSSTERHLNYDHPHPKVKSHWNEHQYSGNKQSTTKFASHLRSQGYKRDATDRHGGYSHYERRKSDEPSTNAAADRASIHHGTGKVWIHQPKSFSRD